MLQLKQVLRSPFSVSLAGLCLALIITITSCSSPSLGDGDVPAGITTKSGITLIKIEPGAFTMGPVGSAAPTTQVITFDNAFYMGKYEVTQAQWESVMGEGSNPSFHNKNPASGEVQDKRPVDTVSFYDAIVFCNTLSIKEGLTPAYSIDGSSDPGDWGDIPRTNNALTGVISNGVNEAPWKAVVCNWDVDGYRLPAEAEWEYACRAGTTTSFNTGSNSLSDDAGWYNGNSNSKTHEVGLKRPNKWGLYDMHGNVGEKVWDWYANYSGKAQTNPRGPASSPYGYRTTRGGNNTSEASSVCSTIRSMGFPVGAYTSVGFRLARTKM